MEPTKEVYTTKSVDDLTCDVMVFSSTKVGNRTITESKPREKEIREHQDYSSNVRRLRDTLSGVLAIGVFQGFCPGLGVM